MSGSAPGNTRGERLRGLNDHQAHTTQLSIADSTSTNIFTKDSDDLDVFKLKPRIYTYSQKCYSISIYQQVVKVKEQGSRNNYG